MFVVRVKRAEILALPGLRLVTFRADVLVMRDETDKNIFIPEHAGRLKSTGSVKHDNRGARLIVIVSMVYNLIGCASGNTKSEVNIEQATPIQGAAFAVTEVRQHNELLANATQAPKSEGPPFITETDSKFISQEDLAEAGLCLLQPSSLTAPAAFLSAFADSLKELRTSWTIIQRLRSGRIKESTEIFNVLNSSKEHFACVIKIMKPYDRSEDSSMIVTSARGLITASLKLISLNNQMRAYTKNILNNEGDLREGTRAEFQAAQTQQYQRAYQLIVAATSAAEFAVIDEKNEALLLTNGERRAIVDKIKKSFSSTHGESQNYLEIAAFQLVNFLNDKWKSAE